MIHWQQYNDIEKMQLLNITSAEKALPRLSIEKDWWVCIVLKALSMTKYADLYSFKGGTGLSKGWNLIERFSEDVDIAISRDKRFAINGTSSSQLAKVRRTTRHYIIKELREELSQIMLQMGIQNFTIEPEVTRFKEDKKIELRADSHPSVLFVNYESILPEVSEYLLPRVKIEISCLSMNEPVEEKTIRSFISEVKPEVDEVQVNFKTVIPTRTFLEKIFLLHEEFQKEYPRSKRMSRHLYDLEKIMDTEFGKQALSNRALYDEIIIHRSLFNKINGIDYKNHSPQTVNIIPPVHLIDEWHKDYDTMADQFLYHQENRMTFDMLIYRMKELTSRLRNLKDFLPDNFITQ
jgi:Domain of unknown function (DUF1814).